jgi:L-ascorbate metabolism protein UlaG (beta-lactamase superfamily)
MYNQQRVWSQIMTVLRVITFLVLTLISTDINVLAQHGVTMSYLGTAGWEISDGRTVILVDPYLSRLKINTPVDPVSDEDPRPMFGPNETMKSDERVIDAHIHRADYILVTHTHFDHSMDVPYIAKKTGATVIGTESTANFGRASAVPDSQLMIVKGGEDLQFSSFSVRVIPSLHAVLPGNLRAVVYAKPPVFPREAKPPFHLGDLLVEGGTLAYLVRLGGQQVFVLGSMNYIERELDGLRPDAAIIATMPEGDRQIYEYTPRLLRLLGKPRLVLPNHWDRCNVPFDLSQGPAIKRLQSFTAEVAAASPKTKVVIPEYFNPIRVDTAQ